MPDDLPQQIELAVDNATPTTYVWRGSSRRMLLAADIERVVSAACPNRFRLSLAAAVAAAHRTRPGRTRLKTRKQQIRSEKLTPQPATAAHWLPVYANNRLGTRA